MLFCIYFSNIVTRVFFLRPPEKQPLLVDVTNVNKKYIMKNENEKMKNDFSQ